MEGISTSLTLECLKCGHKWFRRLIKSPKSCPNCKCRKWDKVRGKGKSWMKHEGIK
jgi:predicted Zn-ribbon and HTH transcriptional regulator